MILQTILIIIFLGALWISSRTFRPIEKLFEAEHQFASDASHELRIPTSGILAECDHAKRKDRTAEEYLESIGHIEAQGERMSALIEELLGITRLQQGTEKYPLRKGDFSEFVSLTAEGFVPQRERVGRECSGKGKHILAAYSAGIIMIIVGKNESIIGENVKLFSEPL